jgi:hypothetical protein
VRSRFWDKGAVFAGWIGAGMALVVAMAFELIIPVQTVVLLLCLPMGILIGVYANVRSERWRPRTRVFANSLYAGVVTGIAIAVLYTVIRLVFLYGDSGALPDGTSLTCQTGPACTYQRYVELGQAEELAAIGITDGPSYEAAAWREFIANGTGLFALTVGGALIGAVGRSLVSVPVKTGVAPVRKPQSEAIA